MAALHYKPAAGFQGRHAKWGTEFGQRRPGKVALTDDGNRCTGVFDGAVRVDVQAIRTYQVSFHRRRTVTSTDQASPNENTPVNLSPTSSSQAFLSAHP